MAGASTRLNNDVIFTETSTGIYEAPGPRVLSCR